MTACSQKDIGNDLIDDETEKYIRQHAAKMADLGLQEIQLKQLDKSNIDQQFYKTQERQFGKYLIAKHGYKICKVQRQEQDLAFYCFALLQAQAKFPIKIFMLEHGKKSNALDCQKSCFKIFWLETSIMVAGQTYSEKKELIFQRKIYNFYMEYMIPEIRKFMKARINWQYMISPKYTDIKVIDQFKKEIIEKGNKEFLKMIKQPK